MLVRRPTGGFMSWPGGPSQALLPHGLPAQIAQVGRPLGPGQQSQIAPQMVGQLLGPRAPDAGAQEAQLSRASPSESMPRPFEVEKREMPNIVSLLVCAGDLGLGPNLWSEPLHSPSERRGCWKPRSRHR